MSFVFSIKSVQKKISILFLIPFLGLIAISNAADNPVPFHKNEKKVVKESRLIQSDAQDCSAEELNHPRQSVALFENSLPCFTALFQPLKTERVPGWIFQSYKIIQQRGECQTPAAEVGGSKTEIKLNRCLKQSQALLEALVDPKTSLPTPLAHQLVQSDPKALYNFFIQMQTNLQSTIDYITKNEGWDSIDMRNLNGFENTLHSLVFISKILDANPAAHSFLGESSAQDLLVLEIGKWQKSMEDNGYADFMRRRRLKNPLQFYLQEKPVKSYPYALSR